MIRALLLALLLAGCAAPVQHDVEAAPAATTGLRFRACQPALPPLPRIRTVEALKRRLADVEQLYLDCSERMRLAVQAYDAATKE